MIAMKTENVLILLACFFGFAVFTGFGGNKSEPGATDATPNKPMINIPVFDEDSAYAFVKQQVGFGPRVPGTPAHTRCAAYFTDTFKSYLFNVTVQETSVTAYNGKLLDCKNIIASHKPEMIDRIFLAAHWDSRPFADEDADPKNVHQPIDGANDGASGAGVLLEIARQISLNKPEIGIDIILFDCEDFGQPEKNAGPRVKDSWCLGSQYWAKHPHKPDYHAKYGILLDMVGATNAVFIKEGFSQRYAPDVVRKVWNAAFSAGYSKYFIHETQGTAIVDDHFYINRITGIPTIDIIHLNEGTGNSFFRQWHTVKDNMDVIDRKTLKAVGQTLMTVIYEAP